MEIKLNENQINQINKLLQSLPISHLDIVKEITAIYSFKNLSKKEDNLFTMLISFEFRK